jgi:hypothetical protein
MEACCGSGGRLSGQTRGAHGLATLHPQNKPGHLLALQAVEQSGPGSVLGWVDHDPIVAYGPKPDLLGSRPRLPCGNTAIPVPIIDISLTYRDRSTSSIWNRRTFMNEFSYKISGRRIHPRTRRVLRRRVLRRQMLGLHSHRHNRFGGCGSGVEQDAERRGRGERIRVVHELHRALASVTRTGDEQLRGEAAQIVAEATSRLNGLPATDR